MRRFCFITRPASARRRAALLAATLASIWGGGGWTGVGVLWKPAGTAGRAPSSPTPVHHTHARRATPCPCPCAHPSHPTHQVVLLLARLVRGALHRHRAARGRGARAVGGDGLGEEAAPPVQAGRALPAAQGHCPLPAGVQRHYPHPPQALHQAVRGIGTLPQPQHSRSRGWGASSLTSSA